jgi:hypothetical protein
MNSVVGGGLRTAAELPVHRAFAEGARALFEEAYPYLEPPRALELSEWLDELDTWTNGFMPLPPSDWQRDGFR